MKLIQTLATVGGLLLAAVLILASCGDSDTATNAGGSATTTAPLPGPATTAPASSVPTTVPEPGTGSTPTTAPGAAPTTAPPSDDGPTTTVDTGRRVPVVEGHYRVVDVAADDVLNGREFADPSSDILTTFEPGELIYLADAGVRLDSGAEWVPTSPDGHFEVWVNRRFLEFVPQVEMAACGEIAEPDPSPGAAVRFHPVAMSPIAVDGCERIVIHLDAGADGRLSDTLTTSIEDDRVIVRLGNDSMGEYWSGDGPYPVTESELLDSGTPVLFTRIGDGSLAIELLASVADVETVAFAEPAVLYIDVWGAVPSTEAGASGFVFPAFIDGTDVMIQGYGRPFEASAGLELWKDGVLVESTAYTATDWLDAWGSWAHLFTDLEAGNYELWIGNGDPRDDEDLGDDERGQWLEFTVS